MLNFSNIRHPLTFTRKDSISSPGKNDIFGLLLTAIVLTGFSIWFGAGLLGLTDIWFAYAADGDIFFTSGRKPLTRAECFLGFIIFTGLAALPLSSLLKSQQKRGQV